MPEVTLVCWTCGEPIAKVGDFWMHVDMPAKLHSVVPREIEVRPLTEDEEAFGRGTWVYCNQHLRAHETGWCGVHPRNKVGLGVKTAQEAEEKCREWGFELYKDKW